MLTNKELLENLLCGRNAADYALEYGLDPEQARRHLNGHYDLTDGLYSTPFVFGFHMVLIEEDAQ